MTVSIESENVQEIPKKEVSVSWLDIGVHGYVKLAIMGALFYGIFHFEIDRIVRLWITEPSWSHGFIIPIFSLYFLNQRKNDILNLKMRPNYLGLVLMILGLVVYVFNMAVPSLRLGYPRQVLMIAVIGAIVLFLGGWALIKYTWLPIVFLIFAVPLPQGYYFRITQPMRLLAADASVGLLNLVSGIEATASGVVINVLYKGQKIGPGLDVAEACSGMRLLLAFVALGVAMAYLQYRPAWQRIILLISTIPIAILCNITRVTITGLIYIFIDPQYTQGIYHDMLGMAMLPLAFALYGLIAWFMSNLFVEEAQVARQDIVERKRQ